jgi:hypothetical protein
MEMSFVCDKEIIEMLKKSKEVVGYLQNVIVEEGTNKVLVGRHRKMADPQWPETTRKVKNDLERELIILHGNVQRGVSEEEAKIRLQRIAEILRSRGIPQNEICSYLVEHGLTPWSERHVERRLPKEYKKSTVPKPKSRPVSTSVMEPETKEIGSSPSQTPRGMLSALLKSTEASYPFPECRCKECPRRTECY